MDNSTSAAKLEATSENLTCPTELPTIQEYFRDLNVTVGVFVIVVILFLITIVIFIKNVKHILYKTPKPFVSKSIVVCSIYPVVAGASLVAIIIPKAFFLCDTISHLMFMFCAYEFFCLCISYVGGESNFIMNSKHDTFTMRTPPCFCCCFWLRRSNIDKKKLSLIRSFVLQLPIVHSIIFVTLNVIYLEDFNLFPQLFLFFVPFIALSIIIGVWGLNITVRMISPYFLEYRIVGKYFALQLVLILCKLQPLLIQGIIAMLYTDCDITLKVLKNVIFQLVLTNEMVLLSLFAQRLYQVPMRNEKDSSHS